MYISSPETLPHTSVLWWIVMRPIDDVRNPGAWANTVALFSILIATHAAGAKMTPSNSWLVILGYNSRTQLDDPTIALITFSFVLEVVSCRSWFGAPWWSYNSIITTHRCLFHNPEEITCQTSPGDSYCIPPPMSTIVHPISYPPSSRDGDAWRTYLLAVEGLVAITDISSSPWHIIAECSQTG